MFEALTEKLTAVFARLGGKGRLTEKDVDEALKEVVHAFEAIFPKVVVTVGILNEDTG